MVAGPEEAIQLSDSSPGRRPGVLVIAFFLRLEQDFFINEN